MRATRAGAPGSFASLVGRFQKPLYQYLRLRTRSAGDAEELVHETFVRAWRHLDRYDDRWRVSTWLYTIARRQTASFYRRRADAPSSDELPVAFDPRPDPASALCAAEDRGELWDLARRLLASESFDALWLRYAEDLAPREIGRVLDRDAASVRVLLHRARRTLAEHLERADEETDRLRSARRA